MALFLDQISLYPIKSLGCVNVSEAVVEPEGLRYDRRYMLVTPAADGHSGDFITQRTTPGMALVSLTINVPDNEIRVWHRHNPADVLLLPLVPTPTPDTLPVSIWDSHDLPAQTGFDKADAWFSRVLDKPCRLVYLPPATRRSVTSRYVLGQDNAEPVVSFADGFPVLVATRASLHELNRRVTGEPMVMERFRPNLVINGLCWPHAEDTWGKVAVGETVFYGVKPCVRCVLTTIDPTTGKRGKEPLQTLATYRQVDNKLLFGENLMPDRASMGQVLRVADSVVVLKEKEPWLPVGV